MLPRQVRSFKMKDAELRAAYRTSRLPAAGGSSGGPAKH